MYAIVIAVWMILQTQTLKLSLNKHQYIALEKTYFVSRSKPLEEMYACKDECLLMRTDFPFQLKYHRLVLSQRGSKNKYLEGHCLLQVDDQWITWEDIQQHYHLNSHQQSLWKEFNKKCQDNTLQIDSSSLHILGFVRIHSEFQFYSNGTFLNVQRQKGTLFSPFILGDWFGSLFD